MTNTEQVVKSIAQNGQNIGCVLELLKAHEAAATLREVVLARRREARRLIQDMTKAGNVKAQWELALSLCELNAVLALTDPALSEDERSEAVAEAASTACALIQGRD